MLLLVENLFKKNPLKDLLSSLNAVISTNERNWILPGHVIFKLRYNQIYQLKTTHNKSSIIFGLKLYTCNASCNDAHGGMAKHWGRIEYFTVLGENFPHHHLSIKNFGIVCPSLGPYFSSSNWRGGHPCCV